MSQIRFCIHGQWKTIHLKLEGHNPAGSLKYRTAAALIQDLEDRGLVTPSTTIVESTSGNLGVALAYLCRQRNYRFLAVIDPKVTKEVCCCLKELGAGLDLVEDPDQTGGYLHSRLRRIAELCAVYKQYIWTNQYGNPANPLAHYLSTAPEIDHQTSGCVDAVFVAVSTGGTLAGIGRYFRERNPRTKVIGVDAAGSVIFGTAPGPRKLTGVGSSQKSQFLTPGLYDDYAIVDDQQAFAMCRRLAQLGINLGGSSGATLAACARYLSEHPGITNPVCICADNGHNYLSTIYDNTWLLDNGYDPDHQIDCIQDLQPLHPKNI